MENVLLICAHPDDHILGAGGTLAKMVSEGKELHTVILSYGELTHPHLKKDIVKKEKKEEAKEADKIIGGKGIKFMGMKEGSVSEELKKNPDTIKKLIKKYSPEKIFTHMPEDKHPDHRAISNKIITDVQELEHDCEVYGFEKWSLLKLRRKDHPKTVIDITGYVNKKVEALKKLESQKLLMGLMKFVTYTGAFLNGLRNDMTFAEIFYRLK